MNDGQYSDFRQLISIFWKISISAGRLFCHIFLKFTYTMFCIDSTEYTVSLCICQTVHLIRPLILLLRSYWVSVSAARVFSGGAGTVAPNSNQTTGWLYNYCLHLHLMPSSPTDHHHHLAIYNL